MKDNTERFTQFHKKVKNMINYETWKRLRAYSIKLIGVPKKRIEK